MPPPALRHLLRAAPLRGLCTAAAPEARRQKLERLADELVSLNKLERFDYAILFHLKTGLNRFSAAAPGAMPAAGAGASPGGAPAAEAAEKTAFDIKLEKYGADAKIKVIKEVRGFTELGLKEAKDLVEKAPVVIKKGVSKEEAAPILEKLKALGATVTLE